MDALRGKSRSGDRHVAMTGMGITAMITMMTDLMMLLALPGHTLGPPDSRKPSSVQNATILWGRGGSALSPHGVAYGQNYFHGSA
eukprot:12424550-Karenia_brevis.AAC.1